MDRDVLVKREKRLRKAILRTLHSARPDGVPGRILHDCVGVVPDAAAIGEFMFDDNMLFKLAQDLVELDLATVEDTRRIRTERRGIDSMVWKITPSGVALIDGVGPKCLLVDDDRI